MSSASSSHHLVQVDSKSSDADRVVINVGGVRYETCKTTLMSIPDTRLANLVSGTGGGGGDPNHTTSEFFFDRDSGAFAPILNYYRTGKLYCPPDVYGPLFKEELAFWGISENDMEPCWWLNFRQHQDMEEALAMLESNERPPECDSAVTGGCGKGQTCSACRAKLWALFDDPHSSLAAMVIGLVSLLFILVSIVAFCVGSAPEYPDMSVSLFSDVEYVYDEYAITSYKTNGVMIVELVCAIWFTVEFLIRIISCPDKMKFVLNVLNIIDFFSILPFFVEVSERGLLTPSAIFFLRCLRAVRCIRLLRIFKIARCSSGIRALGHTLRASVYDLFLIGAFLIVAILIFSILLYCAEYSVNNKIHSMSGALWWAVVTLTTVGYGDIVPHTWFGKVVGSLCALTGILSITLPVPIIVTRFAKFYALAEAKQRIMARGRSGETAHTKA